MLTLFVFGARKYEWVFQKCKHTTNPFWMSMRIGFPPGSGPGSIFETCGRNGGAKVTFVVLCLKRFLVKPTKAR